MNDERSQDMVEGENAEKIDAEPKKKPERETSGQYLWRTIGAGGCILVLALMVLFFISCFTIKS